MSVSTFECDLPEWDDAIAAVLATNDVRQSGAYKRRNKTRDAKIRRLASTGVPIRSIAPKFDLTPQRISQIVNRRSR